DIKPLISEEVLTELIQPLLNGSEKELVFNTEHQRKDGSRYPVEAHLQLQDDEPPVFVAMVQDVTERLKKEAQLHELVGRFNKIASRVPGLVYQFRINPDGSSCIPYASEKIQTIFHLSAEEVRQDASPAFAIIHPDDLERVRTSIQQSADLLEPWKLEYRVCFENNNERWLYANAIPEREADGGTLWHGFVTDITEQKNTELVLQQSQIKYQRLVEEIGDNFVIFSHTGLTGELTYVSDAVEKIADLSKEEVIGRPWGEVVDWLPSSIELGMEVLQRQLEGVTDFEQLELSFNHPDGNLRTLFVSTHPVHNEQGEVIAIEGIAEDISARKFAQEQMRLAASVFANSQEGIFICDKDSRIIDLNPACERLTGYAREEIIGRTPSMFKSDLQDAKFYTKLWDTLTKTGHWQGEVWNRNKSGDLYSERLSIDIVYDDKGALQNYVAVFYDTTYLKEHEKQLEFIAYHDALTRLPNRLLLQDRLQLALAKAKRSGKLLAVCYLDLDGFKPVNDTYGHKIGDKVLVEAAQRMQEAVRADDTVSRIGGDEFVLLMQDIAHIEELEQALQRILDIISSSYSFYEEGCILEVGSISASIGVTLYPDDNSDADILLRHADQAMYRAKYYGKNQYSFFDLGEEKKFTTERTLQQSVELAIEKQEFILLYQPKVNMRTGEVIGVEGLIRWQHPEKGLLTPDKFLSSLQHSQRIVDVGNWVLRRALLQMRDWLAVGIELSVSVNVDAMQLQQTDFVSALKALLVEFSDVPARLLELEITEASALHDIDSVSEIIKECVALGVQFSLDDFGTGYSSLTYLKRLPVQALKVDQSFIRGLAENSDDMVILEGILGLANAFRRTPIAEGVETVRVGVLLLSLGYQFGQGYAISRAMPATAIPQWLAEFDIPPQWRNIENTFESDLSYSLSLLSLSHHRIITRVCHAIEQANPLLIPDYFSDNQLCKLGQWLGTEGEEYYGEASGFAMLVSKHQKMHQLIEEVMQLFGAGEQVSQHYSVELGRLSKELLDDINALKGSVVICC
ncbi:MAG: EAL domain-containing protein, partial [Methyloprofundus sp.]|nr:EAL domain-containing protein [Methyloprofundus sp.]